MIFGIGIDIVEVDRIKSVLRKYGSSFCKKVFTEKEIEYCARSTNPIRENSLNGANLDIQSQHYAGRFAAK